MPEFNSPSYDSHSDWSNDSTDRSFRDLEASLFEFAVPATHLPEMDAELCVLEASDLLPAPRASLRDEFIAEVARIEQRRERLRKAPVAVAFLLLVSVCILWPRSDETRAAAVVTGENPLDRLPATIVGPAALLSASQETDSWALVEAFDGLREKRGATIRKSFAANGSL
jgi:hypothetical protein